MITIIILGLIGIGIGIYIDTNNKYSDRVTKTLYGFMGILGGILLGFIIAISIPGKTEINKHTYNIELLQDNNSISGSFFLGTGTINGEMRDVFYYEENGFYRMKQIDYRRVKIKYSDGQPIIEEYIREVTDDLINKFLIYCGGDDLHYIIYVPKGTIKHNYLLDGQ